MTEKKILTATELKEMGLKIGRLLGNRNLDSKIIKAKKKSLKETGLLIPAVIVEAEKAIREGHEVVDFETGKRVTEENAKDYVSMVDANHRYKAHLELLEKDDCYHKEFYFMYPLQDIPVTKMLSEINIATNPWKVSDYSKGTAMVLNEELPLLTEINILTSKGYSVESARKSFNEDFLKKRTIPDWIISKLKNDENGKSVFIEKMCSFLSGIDREIADEIENYTGKRGEDTKESKVNKKLNELWEEKEI